MKTTELLTTLNPEQQAVVSAPSGHILVLAGAGSGKTRVLVHRIAWLITAEHVSPHAILAVTFTNKAAHEMRGRIESTLNMSLSNMWVGTFHGLAHRLLRFHWQEANLPQSFQILDADDQHRLIRRILKTLNLDEAKWPPKQAQWFINSNKEEGRRAQQVKRSDFFAETMQQIYQAYERICRDSGLVDFAELLLRSLELLQNNPEISAHYQNRFRHILVDEFQDTNAIQYAWLQSLCGANCCVMAVGDDDQSIYSWRGAKIENIMRFPKDFSDTTTMRLEQNYRSTQMILNAANAIIENNSGRFGKKLWTEGKLGEPVALYAAFNERDEAHYVVSVINEWMRDKNHSYRDVAILYRSNAQSRIFEEQLIQSQIAYRIYGGLKFFDRAEIKDALAYLRLLINRNDDAAFERVVNLPTRGIGNTTLDLLRENSREKNISLWQSAEYVVSSQAVSARAVSALNQFLILINTLQQTTQDKNLDELCQLILQGSGLLEHYRKDKSESGLSRLENLEELINAMGQFKSEDDLVHLSMLDAFLAHVALEAGENQADAHSDCVSLMTLHAAKGLEFPLVFIAGMEENLFPHRMSIDEPQGLEEERRLCYVGMTRAMKKLHLIYAESRRLYGVEKFNCASRFINEIPDELICKVRAGTKISRPSNINNSYSSASRYTQPTEMLAGLQIGQRVRHPKFGVGIILDCEGRGEAARIQVKFDNEGSKWLVASFAKLEAV